MKIGHLTASYFQFHVQNMWGKNQTEIKDEASDEYQRGEEEI